LQQVIDEALIRMRESPAHAGDVFTLASLTLPGESDARAVSSRRFTSMGASIGHSHSSNVESGDVAELSKPSGALFDPPRLSVAELRARKLPDTWSGAALAPLLQPLRDWLRDVLPTEDSARARAERPPLLLYHEAVRSAVLLSDWFVRADFVWLRDALVVVWRAAAEADDFLLMALALSGLTRAAGVLHEPTAAVSTPAAGAHAAAAAEAPSNEWLCATLRANVAHSAVVVRMAVLRGSATLLEAGIAIDAPPAANSLLTALLAHCGTVLDDMSLPDSLFTASLAQARRSSTGGAAAPPPPPSAAPSTPSRSSSSDGEATEALLVGVTSAERVCVLDLSAMLVERQPRACDDAGFTTRYVTTCVRVGARPATTAPVLSALFRGLTTLLQAFALSHQQRTHVTVFALKQYPRSDVIKNLLALQLVVACMYTGDADLAGGVGGAHAGGDDEAGPTAHMSNMERVKLLFGEIKQGSAHIAATAVRVLPRLLLDFFAVDQMLLFVLGQFLRQRTLREYTARIMYDVFRQLPSGEQRAQMLHWIVVCLPNFAQVEPPALSRWMIACVLLASTTRAAHAQLLVSLLASRATRVADEVLTVAALAFAADADLKPADRIAFIAALKAATAREQRALASSWTERFASVLGD
jgi:hypothetical protein